MKSSVVCVLSLLLLSSLNTLASNADPKPEPTQKNFGEARSGFKFNGKWINPKIIERFHGWVSDPEEPTILTIDVGAAWNTNRFYDGDVEYKKEGAMFKKEDSQGYYGYDWIGKLGNGIHVVKSYESGGGSGVFQTLLFFEIEQKEGVRSSGKPYQQLVLALRRSASLGDRVSATFDIRANELQATTRDAKNKKVTRSFKF